MSLMKDISELEGQVSDIHDHNAIYVDCHLTSTIKSRNLLMERHVAESLVLGMKDINIKYNNDYFNLGEYLEFVLNKLSDQNDFYIHIGYDSQNNVSNLKIEPEHSSVAQMTGLTSNYVSFDLTNPSNNCKCFKNPSWMTLSKYFQQFDTIIPTIDSKQNVAVCTKYKDYCIFEISYRILYQYRDELIKFESITNPPIPSKSLWDDINYRFFINKESTIVFNVSYEDIILSSNFSKIYSIDQAISKAEEDGKNKVIIYRGGISWKNIYNIINISLKLKRRRKPNIRYVYFDENLNSSSLIKLIRRIFRFRKLGS